MASVCLGFPAPRRNYHWFEVGLEGQGKVLEASHQLKSKNFGTIRCAEVFVMKDADIKIFLYIFRYFKTTVCQAYACVYMTLGMTSFLSADFWDLKQNS